MYGMFGGVEQLIIMYPVAGASPPFVDIGTRIRAVFGYSPSKLNLQLRGFRLTRGKSRIGMCVICRDCVDFKLAKDWKSHSARNLSNVTQK